jgi:hypothetical protein
MTTLYIGRIVGVVEFDRVLTAAEIAELAKQRDFE